MKKRPFKIIACISDIHIGNRRITADYMKRMLKEEFFNKIKKFKYLDAILVGGDISHSLLSLSSSYGALYMWFVDKLHKLAKNKGITVGILEGTPSHDVDHLSVVENLYCNDPDVKFYVWRKPEIVRILGDYRVLVLPDKKVNKEAKKHIESLMEEKVDMILGHGIIDKLSFFKQESENLNAEAYVYSTRKMMDNCKGPILFGHIHAPTNIKNQFYYIGSFTKLERTGGIHGFLTIGIMDQDKSKFKVEMFPNRLSVDFHKISINEKDLDKFEALDMVNAIRNYIEEKGKNDLYTVKLSMTSSTYHIDKALLIEDAFRHIENVSLVKSLTELEEEKEEEEVISEKKKKLQYLFDEGLPVEEILLRYFREEVKPFNTKYEKIDLTLEKIKEVLGE